MNAATHPLVQAATSRHEAEVLELFPSSTADMPFRQPHARHSNDGTNHEQSSDDPEEARGSKRRLMASELGMATAEYAIATLAAVGFAGLLVVILRSEEVRGFLLNLIRTALALP
ncbi:DUF4244 domain-containing protein [Arthrobacter sp. MA-N2]|uniref:DUF4244 domain-containing protein n=1 Tax=Arthrobacter sp. MA-N2 TaxID=1101188 RepID=UPI0004848B2A